MKNGAKRIRWTFKTKMARLHARHLGHRTYSYVGYYPKAAKPTRMKISECRDCQWWDNEF